MTNVLECTKMISLHRCLLGAEHRNSFLHGHTLQNDLTHSLCFLRSLFNSVTQSKKEMHINEGKKVPDLVHLFFVSMVLHLR